MAMGKKEARRLLSVAKNARDASTMNRARFGSIANTDDIKEATRLYRSSWITHPLEEIIKALEKHT